MKIIFNINIKYCMIGFFNKKIIFLNFFTFKKDNDNYYQKKS